MCHKKNTIHVFVKSKAFFGCLVAVDDFGWSMGIGESMGDGDNKVIIGGVCGPSIG